MRRHAKAAASITDTKLKKSSSFVAAGVPVGLPGKAVAGGEEGTGPGGSGAGGGSGWEDTGSTNPTTPIVEGGAQNAMPGGAPGGVSVPSEPSPLLLQKQQQNSQRQHAQQQQQYSPQQQQQQQHVSDIGQDGENHSGSRGKSARMTFSRKGSGVLLADVARRVSRSFSRLSRGRSNAEQANDDAGTKKLGGGGVSVGPAADESAPDTKNKVRSVNNQNSSTSSGPTPDEATATYNTDGTVEADGTPAGAAPGRGSAVKMRMSLLKRGALSSSSGKGSATARAGGAGGDRASSGQQQEGYCGLTSTGGHQHAAASEENNRRQAATTLVRGQGTKSNSSSNVAATSAGSYTRCGDAAAQVSGGGEGHHSRRGSSVAGGSSTGEKAGAGGAANVPHEAVASAHSRRKFHIPHPHLPGHFRHKHQQELQSGGPSIGESKAAHRQQAQPTGEGNSVTGGEEGGCLVTGASGLSATGAGGAAARGAASAAVPPHHQSHLPLLHLGNLLHHHKGMTTAAAADQQTQQSQQQTQQHHHLLPHLHLLHGGPAAAEPSAAADAGEDSMELLAQLHAAHERARDIVERSRTQREQLLQRAREEVEEEAQVMRREAALMFEEKQEKSDEQTEEACRAAAAAGDDVVRVDPTALLQASQLCVAETLKVGVHLPEDFRKRLSVIHQHPPTFFRRSCADQYPSTRGLKDPAVLQAALHHAYRDGYQSSERQCRDVSYVVDEGACSAYRGAGLDILGGASNVSSVSDANREAYAAILGERGAWTEQDDEFRLDLREDAALAGENGQRQTLLESILSWFLLRSTCSTGDASSIGTSVAAGGRKEDERSNERRAPTMCHCWPLVSTDSS